jgi:uncharacterized protein (TIGR03437 family)
MRRRLAFLFLVMVGLFVILILAAGCGGSGKPMINSISPAEGKPMSEVIIFGSGFGRKKGMSVVQFSGNAVGVKVWSDTKIVATVPSDMKPGLYTVTVVTDTATSPSLPFQVK